MNGIEYVLPSDIEKRSFEIIATELSAMNIILPEDEKPVTMRVIHTTADFEYAETMCYSSGAVAAARKLLQAGADIVTDTNMAKAGINKNALSRYGGEIHCFMADADVADEAKKRQLTRAYVSMERAANLGKKVIFAIGNAPTALISLYEMMEKGVYTPDFVIGVPVGFVNVVAAKELFLNPPEKTRGEKPREIVPYIINKGRKGGSGVAAAICNALLYGLDEARV